MLISPKLSIDACLNGVVVWARTLVPALFPFFFITKILAELGVFNKLGQLLSPITQKLYNVPGDGGYVYVMGIISGYPVSSKITSDLYSQNIISRGQACRIVSFTSTSGPLFIIGSVGIGMFASYKAGIVILISHIIGASLNGLLYRNYMKDEKLDSVPCRRQARSNENLLEEAMLSSIKSVLIVGGYVCFFFMVITIINYCGMFTPINFGISKMFNVTYSTVSSITNGVIEMTKGCFDISLATQSLRTMTVLGTAMISFGGFSIFLQALTFLKRFNISTRYFLCVKTTQCIISTIIAYLLSIIIL